MGLLQKRSATKLISFVRWQYFFGFVLFCLPGFAAVRIRYCFVLFFFSFCFAFFILFHSKRLTFSKQIQQMFASLLSLLHVQFSSPLVPKTLYCGLHQSCNACSFNTLRFASDCFVLLYAFLLYFFVLSLLFLFLFRSFSVVVCCICFSLFFLRIRMRRLIIGLILLCSKFEQFCNPALLSALVCLLTNYVYLFHQQLHQTDFRLARFCVCLTPLRCIHFATKFYPVLLPAPPWVPVAPVGALPLANCLTCMADSLVCRGCRHCWYRCRAVAAATTATTVCSFTPLPQFYALCARKYYLQFSQSKGGSCGAQNAWLSLPVASLPGCLTFV